MNERHMRMVGLFVPYFSERYKDYQAANIWEFLGRTFYKRYACCRSLIRGMRHGNAKQGISRLEESRLRPCTHKSKIRKCNERGGEASSRTWMSIRIARLHRQTPYTVQQQTAPIYCTPHLHPHSECLHWWRLRTSEIKLAVCVRPITCKHDVIHKTGTT